ncbi:MAG: zinc-binding dehydrogenase [Crocinitomicaceae bacterium]
MKTEAIVLVKKGKPNQAFEQREWTIPAIKPDQVIIESEAFGLNYADVMASQGLYREAPPMPCVIGYEVVGKIVEVGAEIDAAWIGKRVLAFCRFGGYSKHVITENFAFVAIDDMPAGDALSLCTQGVTAYYMSHYLSPVRKGERVLIHAAAGGVGTLLIQLCKMKGAEVFAKIGSSKKANLVKSLGADHVIDYSQSDYANQIHAILGNDRLDVSFNPVAGDTFKKDFKLIGSGGRLMLFGGSQLSSGKYGIFSALNFMRKMGFLLPIGFMMRSKNLLGINMLKIADNKPMTLFHCLENVLDLYKEGKLKPEIGGSFPVAEFTTAIESLASGKSTGKIGVYW